MRQRRTDAGGDAAGDGRGGAKDGATRTITAEVGPCGTRVQATSVHARTAATPAPIAAARERVCILALRRSRPRVRFPAGRLRRGEESEACAAVRSLMARQLQRDRIARGFRDAGVRFSGKTGSFGGAFRNEVGVLEYPAGRHYAIAVFTRAHVPHTRWGDIDDAIGAAARLAVDALRGALT